MKESQDKISVFAGAAILLLFLIGIAAFVLAGLAAFQAEFVGAGVCLIAAGVAHGLLLNALIRR